MLPIYTFQAIRHTQAIRRQFDKTFSMSTTSPFLTMPTPKLSSVLDPLARRDNAAACVHEVDWLAVELESQWVDRALDCEARLGFIFEIHDRARSENKKWVYIHESVCTQISQITMLGILRTTCTQLLILKHFEQRFEVCYTTWDIHKRRMLQEDGWVYYVDSSNCFFGGPDLGLDLGCVCGLLEGVILTFSQERMLQSGPRWRTRVSSCHGAPLKRYTRMASRSRAK